MAEPYEKFKNLTAGIQSIVIAFAVIVGGAWTAYTFWILQASQKAQTDLAKTEQEIVVNKRADERDQTRLQMQLTTAETQQAQAQQQLADKQREFAIEKRHDDRQQTEF